MEGYNNKQADLALRGQVNQRAKGMIKFTDLGKLSPEFELLEAKLADNVIGSRNWITRGTKFWLFRQPPRKFAAFVESALNVCVLLFYGH